jgi:hypothetical protein
LLPGLPATPAPLFVFDAANAIDEANIAAITIVVAPPFAFSWSPWRSARTTNAIERLHEEFKRRIKTQTVLPSADTAAMLGAACLRPDQHAQDRWLADTCHKAHRSPD